MDGELYDEFGNYIGPEIEEDEEEDVLVAPQEDEEMADREDLQAAPEEVEGM